MKGALTLRGLQFYSNVGALQASTIPESNKDPKDFLNDNHPDSMFLHPVNKEEIEKAGQKLAKKTIKRTR